jgi:CheY-like chemotaxis protein
MSIKPWKILVIDDDEGIHSITRMVFRGYEFEQRPIHLINALSGAQAKTILQQQPDIALAILDVVMETDDAGLQLVNYIREQTNNSDIRIILRTGHPGFAPEADVIIKYDINDYLSKAELSASRLLTSVLVALRSYRDIQTAKRKPLKNIQSVDSPDDHNALEFLADFSILLERSLEPLKQQSRKLQQFNHKPMITDLVNSLGKNCEKIADLSLLIKPISAGKTSHIQITTELDRLLNNYLSQAKNEDWIIDYEIAEDLYNSINVDVRWFNTLLVCLLEFALSQHEQNDLIITLTSKNQRIKIDIAGISSKSFNSTHWQQFLLFKLEQLSQQYQGIIMLDETGCLISFSFEIYKTWLEK